MRLRVIFNNIPQKEIHLIYHYCYYHYYEVMPIEGREENILKAKDKYHVLKEASDQIHTLAYQQIHSTHHQLLGLSHHWFASHKRIQGKKT